MASPAVPIVDASRTTISARMATAARMSPLTRNDQPISAARRPRARRHSCRSVSFSARVPRATSSTMMPCRAAVPARVNSTEATLVRMIAATDPTVMVSRIGLAGQAHPGQRAEDDGGDKHQGDQRATPWTSSATPKVGFGLRRRTRNEAPRMVPRSRGRSGISPALGGGVQRRGGTAPPGGGKLPPGGGKPAPGGGKLAPGWPSAGGGAFRCLGAHGRFGWLPVRIIGHVTPRHPTPWRDPHDYRFTLDYSCAKAMDIGFGPVQITKTGL